MASISESAYTRLAAVGALISGGLAIILALNASLDSNYLGAGVLLVASALSFGFIIGVVRSIERKRRPFACASKEF